LPFEFAILGSGSKGNAVVIRAGAQTVLLDCGFTLRELTQRLSRLELSPADLSAVLVTHEHSDHSKGVGALGRKYKLPVYMTPGTFLSGVFGEGLELQLFHAYQPFEIGNLCVTPVAVPHDAREPAQFTFSYQGVKLGILTDLGCITPHVIHAYRECNGLILEANHDCQMLAEGPYPARLKARVGGNWGHLNNLQALEMLQAVASRRLEKLVIAHISENNNCPLKVHDLFSTSITQERLYLAEQEKASAWMTLARRES